VEGKWGKLRTNLAQTHSPLYDPHPCDLKAASTVSSSLWQKSRASMRGGFGPDSRRRNEAVLTEIRASFDNEEAGPKTQAAAARLLPQAARAASDVREERARPYTSQPAWPKRRPQTIKCISFLSGIKPRQHKPFWQIRANPYRGFHGLGNCQGKVLQPYETCRTQNRQRVPAPLSGSNRIAKSRRKPGDL
jgi:hypothetical protein